MSKQILAIIFFGCLVQSVIAQRSIKGDLFLGKVLEHKEGLLFDIPPLAAGFNLTIIEHTKGDKAWHHYWGMPTIEGLFQVMNYGNNEVLGTAFAIAPGIGFKLKEWNQSKLILHYSTGIAYLTKKFDPEKNPTNNAIGSNLNNISRLKLSIEKTLSKKLILSIGASFNHYSNGLTSSPNSGINTYGINFGLKTPLGRTEEALIEKPEFIVPKKFGLVAMGGIGVSEHSNYGGPNFPIYFVNLGGYWRHRKFQKLHLGVEYEFSHKIYEFELSVFNPEEIARRKATRTVVYIGEELMFGPVSMRLQLGFYTKLLSDKQVEPLYIKVMTLYHPPIKNIGEARPFVGMILKTHFAVAEYIGIATGISF